MYADNKCCKGRRGKVYYSEEIKKLSGRILILKLIKRRLLLKGKPNRPRSKQVKRLIKKFNYEGNHKIDNLKEIEGLLRDAHKKI